MTKTPLSKRAQDRSIIEVPLDKLLLDAENPRFAGNLETASQEGIVDFIADEIGLADLLSSMSKGGFYRSSPLIVVAKNSNYIVVEGNRRLAAALILSGESRARGQEHRARNYEVRESAADSLTELPVLVASSRDEVLPYLGIAHIVGNKKWDSYAKAAWAAKVAESDIYPGGLAQIADEIGDQHRTLERMVHAYKLVRELERTARFDPKDTVKKGRGTASYPFSWVYTALGFTSIRNWLGLDSKDQLEDEPTESLLKSPDEQKKAADLMDWMFGSQSRNHEPALTDSRQISDLAVAVTDERVLSQLRRGRTLDTAKDAVKPPHEKLLDTLASAREELEQSIGVLGSNIDDITERQRRELLVEAKQTSRVATRIVTILEKSFESFHEA